MISLYVITALLSAIIIGWLTFEYWFPWIKNDKEMAFQESIINYWTWGTFRFEVKCKDTLYSLTVRLDDTSNIYSVIYDQNLMSTKYPNNINGKYKIEYDPIGETFNLLSNKTAKIKRIYKFINEMEANGYNLLTPKEKTIFELKRNLSIKKFWSLIYDNH